MKKEPIAYGYMRVRQEASDQELKLIEDRMHAYADARGLRLTYTHYEWGPGLQPHYLIRRLIQDDVRHVIVPSLMQITEHPLMQAIVADWISLDAGALLYETSDIRGWAEAL